MYARHHVFTVHDYLALEAETGNKHEFIGGQVWAMAGGSREHALYAANVTALLAVVRRGKRCAVHSADLRVCVKASGLLTYADATVICGRVELDPNDPKRQTVINPRVIVEVLSPSTEDYDRGEKLGQYKTIRSLQEVMLVAHDRREIEVVRREKDGSWSRHIATEGARLTLVALACQLAVDEIYRDPLARTARAGRRATGRRPRPPT